MEQHVIPAFTWLNATAAVIIALVYILLMSLIKEPSRQQINALMIAGAGAAYFRGGFGVWELVFAGLMTFIAFKGLSAYTFIGIGWVLHAIWDVLHHLYGNAIIPFDASSSAGCALCDAVLATWFFYGAPNVFSILKGRAAV